jgi:transposase
VSDGNLPARVGRPSKAEHVLTPEMLEAVGLLLAEGHFKETVADFLGIDRTTWWRWEQRGEQEPGSIFAEFCNVVKKASAAAEILLLRGIRAGGEGWQSKAWISERRFPQRWGKRVEITVRQEAERLASEIPGCTAADLIAEAEAVAARMGR